MLSVYSEGGTIYPAEQLQSTPRYDNGPFLSAAQDLRKKDIVELALRLFDREQLKLIPALNFGTPLPQLETIKRQSGEPAIGLEWIGRDGKAWTDRSHTQRGLGPHYNVLHPKVQEAMLDVVDELANRYATHPSLAGVAIQLSSDTYAELPGLAWGFDDYTISQFEADTKIKIAAEGPDRFAQRSAALLGTHRRAWTVWRAARLTKFYQTIADHLTTARSDLKLYLSGTELFKSAELRSTLKPTLPPRPLDESLLEIGLDSKALATQPKIVLLRPQQISPPSSRGSPLYDLKVNDTTDLDRELREATNRGAIFYHPPYRLPLPSFDELGPLRNSHFWLVAQLSPSGSRNRQRFVRSLSTLDSEMIFDGGWLLGLGQEDSVRDLISTYRSLPRAAWRTIDLETQPVIVRTCVHKGRTYLYLVNDSPWPVDLEVNLNSQADLQWSELSGHRAISPVEWTAAASRWKVALEPYDLLGVVASNPVVRVNSVKVVLPDIATNELRNRIEDFQARAIALQSQIALPGPKNAGFEALPSSTGEIEGWTKNEQAGFDVLVDASQKFSGARSLKIASAGPLGIVASDEFEAPATGRLELAVRLRIADEQAQVPLRIALEGNYRGERFYRHAQLGGGNNAVPLSIQWAQYVAQFDNLPVDGFTTLRVRFELLGRGEVWIDDLQLYHLRFREAERVELFKLGTSAQLKLKDGHYSDCLRLLEGYWPQFLLAHVPLMESPVAQRPVERQAVLPESKVAPPTEGSTGFMDRLRGWVPGRWR